jgi:tight adherence protein C
VKSLDKAIIAAITGALATILLLLAHSAPTRHVLENYIFGSALSRHKLMKLREVESLSVKPYLWRKVNHHLSRINREKIETLYVKKLAMAGLSEKTSVEEIYWIKTFLTILVTVASILAKILFNQSVSLSIIIASGFVGFQAPDLYLAYKRKKRRAEIIEQMPEVLELMILCTNGGMGLHRALQTIITKKGGAFSDELQKCLREVEIGVRLQDALANMSRLLEMPEVNTFVNSLIQSIRMGNPIETSIKALIIIMRQLNAQRIEEKIGSLPLKMTVITLCFFMPLVFTITLMPSLISFMQNSW